MLNLECKWNLEIIQTLGTTKVTTTSTTNPPGKKSKFNTNMNFERQCVINQPF